MLITCSSCNSKYLVNSADLKPNGRTVRCAICGFDWFQSSDLLEEKKKTFSTSTSQSSEKNANEKNNINTKSEISNLPSTYVMDQQPSIINTLLLLFFFSTVVICFWLIKNEGANVITLANFYIQEFYFNLNLIIDDMARIIHQILN